jgi:3-deoxy-7-phosphoheptulonate synthase
MGKIALNTVKAPASIMVDCSHANSGKDPSKQPSVLDAVMNQVADGADCIHAVMIESHLHSGTQAFPRPVEQLDYGVSITDGCISWDETEACLRKAAGIVDKARFS